MVWLDAEIVDLAEEIGAGLIVMGSRGYGPIRQALIGSVSDSVVRHAHCPVMVVRGEPLAFPTNILLAHRRIGGGRPGHCHRGGRGRKDGF